MLSNTNSLEFEGNFLIFSFSNVQMFDSDPTDYYFGLRNFRLLLFFIPRSFIMILLSLGKDRSFKTYKIMANDYWVLSFVAKFVNE